MLPMILLLQAATAAPATTPPAPPPPWTAVSRTDPKSGATSTSAYANSKDNGARLTVRCDTVAEHVVSIQLRTRAPMAAAADQMVSVSIDGGDPIAAMWQFPGVAMLNSNPATITAVTTALAKAHSVRVTWGEGPTALAQEFDGPTSPDGINTVLNACGYQMGVVPPDPTAKKDKK